MKAKSVTDRFYKNWLLVIIVGTLAGLLIAWLSGDTPSLVGYVGVLIVLLSTLFSMAPALIITTIQDAP